MIGSAAAGARGRGRSSWSRKQGEVNTNGIGKPDDDDPAKRFSVIRVRGVVESLISVRRRYRRAARPSLRVARMRGVFALATVLAIAGSAPAQARITVPRGVRVGTVARGVGQPTNIAFDARGHIWTTSAGYVNAGSDGVWVTPRAGARPRHVIRRLYTALGLAWFRGELYVSYVTPYSDRIDPVYRRGRIEAFSRFDGRRFHRRRTVLRNLPVGAHNVDSIVVGPNGRLFAGIGAPKIGRAHV